MFKRRMYACVYAYSGGFNGKRTSRDARSAPAAIVASHRCYHQSRISQILQMEATWYSNFETYLRLVQEAAEE